MPPLDLALPRVPDAAIVVDGRADEPAWADGLVLPDALVFAPSDEVSPVGAMRTTLLADDVALHVHFAVTDPEPGLVRAGLGRRDTRDDDDAVGLYVDPSGDGRRAFLLVSNAIGVQSDAIRIAGERDDDPSWDAVWRSAGRRTPTGFEVEMAIPWPAIHVSGNVDAIGLVAVRTLSRKGQAYAWPKVEPGTDPLLAAARIRGPGALPRRIGLEILPEITGAWSEPRTASGRLEYKGVGPGVTLRYAPGGRFGAVGTFNPDFSQLESDASQIDVNQRYALSYEEKRPFFLEGQDWFDHPVDGMIYTRAMNAPLYGVRAVGEVGRVGVAALHVMDMAPPPSVNEGGGWTAEQLDGHAALATLARTRVGLGGDSYIGLFGSDRTVLDTDLSNRVLGLDSTIRLNRNATLEAAAMGSATAFADGEALAPAGKLGASWSSERLYLHATADAIAPGFRQENGFVTQEDFAGAFTEDHVKFTPPVDWIQQVSVEPLDAWSYWRFDGTPRQRGYDPSVWAQFGNGAFVKVDGRFGGEEFAGAWVDYANLDVYASTSVGEGLRVELATRTGTSPFYDPAAPRAGRLQAGEAEIELQPVPRFTLALAPELARMTELDGTPLYVAWTGRVKAELFLHRSVWLRGIAEFTGRNTGDATWRLEPVAAWEWTPGRAIYLGGAWADDAAWQVFAKAGWVFVL